MPRAVQIGRGCEVLPDLLSYQPIIVLRVLVICFGRDQVAGCMRIAGELLVFFRDDGSRPPNLHIRAVCFVEFAMRVVPTLAPTMMSVHTT